MSKKLVSFFDYLISIIKCNKESHDSNHKIPSEVCISVVMSDKESDPDQQCQSEGWKSNVIENQNQNELAVAESSNIESPPSGIFKMDINCFEKLFEWLSVADLRTLRLTCNRFKQIVDYYISMYYPDIGKFKLNDENFDMFRQMDLSTIEWIREIDVSVTRNFDGIQFSAIKNILNNVKKIIITEWITDVDFYNCFLKYCKNLKCLSIKGSKKYGPISIYMNNEWLCHQYPSLEYISFEINITSCVEDLVKFFHLNPNIHAISIDITYFKKILLNLIEAGIKFDRLYTYDWYIDEKWSLEKLYNVGFYKRLSLNTKCIYPEAHLWLATCGTEVLNIRFSDYLTSSLKGLKELNIESHCDFNLKFEIVKNLVERFSCYSIHSDDILTFIGKFPKLKHFKIECIFGTRVLNLIAMNKTRQNLAGACKTIIYVENDVFSATKWATRKTNFNLIELKRIQTCDWKQFFENDCKKCEQISDQQNHIKKLNWNQNQNEVVRPSSNSKLPSSGIFKLNIDCFEELFEWLSLADIIELRRICKRFKNIVDYYIRTNYPGIGTFKLNDKNFNIFHQMDSGTIGWIREIDVSVTHDFDFSKFESIKELLNNVPKISITQFGIMKYCTNVKFLSIKRRNCYILQNIIHKDWWLSRSYRSLEYFHIDYIWKGEVTFFHLNPNIHAISIELDCLKEIGSQLIAAGIKFDRLYIDATDRQINETDIDPLKQLYNSGFYKRLHLNSKHMLTKYAMDNLRSIGTEVLSIKEFNIKIPSLPSLKELNIDGQCYFDVRYVHVKNVVERLSCKSIYFRDLLAFIGNFPKLKHFKIDLIWYKNELNLFAMNKERQKLAGACKTTIYVHEVIFLATKWAETKTNFNLIELKRIQTCDWDQFFESNCGKCPD